MLLKVNVLALFIFGVSASYYHEAKIVGGSDASIEDFPYQLSLALYGNLLCGASIVAREWAMTAAHCVDGLLPSQISLRALSNYASYGGTVHTVRKIYIHPSYNYSINDYDVALISVRHPFRIVSTILWNAHRIKPANTEPQDNTLLTVSGYGNTEFGGEPSFRLRAVNVLTINRTKCNEDTDNEITSRMLCAGYDEGGRDACQGDSGGPLVDRAKGVQVGIVSWGIGCALPNEPGIYTNVAYPEIRNWIKKISGV